MWKFDYWKLNKNKNCHDIKDVDFWYESLSCSVLLELQLWMDFDNLLKLPPFISIFSDPFTSSNPPPPLSSSSNLLFRGLFVWQHKSFYSVSFLPSLYKATRVSFFFFDSCYQAKSQSGSTVVSKDMANPKHPSWI